MSNLISNPLSQILLSPFVFRLPAAQTGLKKNEHVETLRGLAIILVVFGHMIGSEKTGGMKVADDSVFRYLYYSLEFIRMPLFTVISGWVYAYKPILQHSQGKFLSGKIRRLLLPMFVISTLLFLFRMVVPGTSTRPQLEALPGNLVFPYDVYWYLFSLFLIFIVISFIDTTSFLKHRTGWFAAFGLSLVALYITQNFLNTVPNFFSFKGAMYLFPFFLVGIGIFRFRDMLQDRRLIILAALVFVVAFSLQQFLWFSGSPLPEKKSLLGLAVGFTSVLLLFRLRLRSNLLIRIGAYAYGIFLFHVFFTGGSRILFLKAGIQNQWVILILGVVLAIIVSIAAEVILNRNRVLRFLFLGLKKQEK